MMAARRCRGNPIRCLSEGPNAEGAELSLRWVVGRVNRSFMLVRALRIRRMVDALTRWPSLSSSPWIRWYPQLWFWVASRSRSAVISALTGGRPVRCG